MRFAGEDPELKHLAWVVENLQEELIRANGARIAADGEVARLQAEVQALQVLSLSMCAWNLG